MLTALYTIIVFCLIIAIHEFGHFAVAKLVGITVHEFAIGMGPKIFSHKGKKTDYSLRLLPIGGYVKLEGEDEASDDINAFCNKKPWQRFLVLFAGAFMNFVLGFVLFAVILSSNGAITTNVVDKVIPGSSFEKSGILSGDKIVYMESENYESRISDYNDINFFVYQSGDSETKITFKRNGEEFTKSIEPSLIEGYEGKMFGFSAKVEKPNLLNVPLASFRQSKFVVKLVIQSFIDLFTGKVPVSDLSGPVGIVNEIGTAAKTGLAVNLLQSILNVMWLAALISINLGVVNLLPLPALDGGRILFIIIEFIRRKPVDRDKEGIIHLIGFALLIVMMIAVTFSDIKRLIP